MNNSSNSPQLPPKFPTAVNSAHNQDNDEGDNALSNMPAHLRDRFKKSKQQSRIRRQSKSNEECQHVQEKEPPPELPSQQKPLASNPYLQNQLPKSQGYAKASNKSELLNETASNKPSGPDTSGKIIKDRLKIFSSSDNNEPTPPKSPVLQKWPPSNSFERKQPGVSSLGKPPVEDTKQKMFPPKVTPESKKPICNEKETPSVPPLPDRNTKPPKFGGFKPGSISKRPPMPLPPTTSYNDVSCLCIIFKIYYKYWRSLQILQIHGNLF